jgi:anti-anti-sigma factor
MIKKAGLRGIESGVRSTEVPTMHANLADLSLFGDTRVADVRAEIDLANAHLLEAALAAPADDKAGNFILSLSGCPYIDSSGLRVVIRLSNTFGSHFAVVAGPGCHARRIIDVAGLGKTIPIFDSLEPALESLAGNAARTTA